jgi:hypothetical protein
VSDWRSTLHLHLLETKPHIKYGCSKSIKTISEKLRNRLYKIYQAINMILFFSPNENYQPFLRSFEFKTFHIVQSPLCSNHPSVLTVGSIQFSNCNKWWNLSCPALDISNAEVNVTYFYMLKSILMVWSDRKKEGNCMSLLLQTNNGCYICF